MSTLPKGIVTSRFTGVEGSTRLAKGLGDARWAQLLEEHRRNLLLAISAHAGREAGTQVGASFVAFTRPTDVVAGAIEGLG